jgi:hypothetical protein
MMKKVVFTLFALIAGTALFSQTQPFGIKFSGFAREDAIFDSRQVEQLREGMFLFYPLNVSPDKNGDDLNARSSFNLFAIGCRLSGAITGPDAFGAKTSGLIEGEFFGASNTTINTFRLRHGFVKLNWSKTELLVGQTWHSLFTEECVPGTLNFNTGSPFQPFNRSPQIRLKQNISERVKISLATITQRDFTSTGPAGASYQYLSNSSIPEITLGISYERPKTENSSLLSFGLVGEFKQLLPRLVTDSNVQATKRIESFAGAAYFNFENKKFGIKAKAVYGENLYDQLMLGGYAIKYDSIAAVYGDWDYTNLITGSFWVDAFVNIGKVNVGLFGGYTQNFGSNQNIKNWADVKSYYARGVNIDHVYRVAPRISCTFDKVKIGFEFDYTVAAYGESRNSLGVNSKTTDNPLAKITEVGNSRFLGMIQYNF